MATVSWVWYERQGQWQLVTRERDSQLSDARVTRIGQLLGQENAPRDKLRRYLQRVFKGQVALDSGVINGRQWCEISKVSVSPNVQPESLEEKIYRTVQQTTQQNDIHSMLALFNAPVALLNCKTGRSICNTMWQQGLEILDASHRQAIKDAMRHLCQTTPAHNDYVSVDHEHGLLLLRQHGQVLGAWRLMLWYTSGTQRLDSPTVLDLTRAERAVCLSLQYHLSVKQIAQLRGVSVHTIRSQLRSIFRKLGVKSQHELLLRLDVTPKVLQ